MSSEEEVRVPPHYFFIVVSSSHAWFPAQDQTRERRYDDTNFALLFFYMGLSRHAQLPRPGIKKNKIKQTNKCGGDNHRYRCIFDVP